MNLDSEWGEIHSETSIRERIESTRVTGYAVNPALIVEGSWGMGAAVFDRNGRPAWALSLTGVETRFRPARHAELGTLLLEHAHTLSNRFENACSELTFGNQVLCSSSFCLRAHVCLLALRAEKMQDFHHLFIGRPEPVGLGSVELRDFPGV